MNDINYMKEAINEANKAKQLGEIPVGAIIVLFDKIIGRGHNLKEQQNTVTKHAELIAIEEASKQRQNWRLNDCIMYVTEQPCPMCASAIKQSRIKKIVYYNEAQNIENKKIVERIFLINDHNPIVECEKIKDDSLLKESMKSFFVDKRKN